jgi:hypothetical protein
MSERTSLVSLVAALVVAIAGLIPVIWMLASPAEDSVDEGEVVVVATTTTQPESTTVVVEPIPELDVQDLDPAVVRVLQANGYAELVGEPGLEEDLPDAVTRLLIERGAVLTVVEEDPAAEEGS